MNKMLGLMLIQNKHILNPNMNILEFFLRIICIAEFEQSARKSDTEARNIILCMCACVGADRLSSMCACVRMSCVRARTYVYKRDSGSVSQMTSRLRYRRESRSARKSVVRRT